MQRLPEYLKRGIIDTDKTKKVRNILKTRCLNTVCEQARCPNKAECYAKDTATFLIMGSTCTRNCKFCNIKGGKPEELDIDEPTKIALSVKELELDYAVITSVTRDDLPDGGAEHFAKVIYEIKNLTPNVKIEVLTPDFKGSKYALDIVIKAKPDVFNHNIETAKELYSKARPMANYEQSLNVLKYVKEKDTSILTKSGMMVGLGETKEQIITTLKDLHSVGCDIVTIGQYIQPSKQHIEVEKYYKPEEYEDLTQIAKEIGIKFPVFAPLVRSSYKAKECVETIYS